MRQENKLDAADKQKIAELKGLLPDRVLAERFNTSLSSIRRIKRATPSEPLPHPD